MKKRIIGLALVLVMLFAFSAWATPRLRINTSKIADVTKGASVSETLDFDYEDIEEDNITWTCDPSEAQGGISFADGAFSGTAGTTGSYTFKVTATGTYTDANDTEQTITATKSYTIKVKPKAPGDITLTTELSETDYDLDELVGLGTNKAGLLVGTAMTADTIVFQSTATLPVTFTVTGLPSGITAAFSGTNAEEDDADTENNAKIALNGTPTKAGVYSGITITITNSAGTAKSGPYTLRVFDKAKITTKKISDITWGKEYSFKLAATGGLNSDYPITWDADTTTLDTAGLTGFTFDAETGILSGTLTTADEDNNVIKFVSSKDFEIPELKFKAVSPIGTDDANSETISFPITVKAVGPTITDKASAQASFDDIGFTIKNTDGTLDPSDGEIEFAATGPGTIKWSVSKLPDGFVSEDAENAGDPFKIKATSTMAQTVKRFPVSVTAKNGAGSDVITFYMNVDLADGDKVKIANVELPSGIHKVGDSVDTEAVTTSALPAAAAAKAKKSGNLPANRKADDEDPKGTVALTAYPGPITWSANGLPSGVKLSIDKSVSFDTKVYLVGSFKKETKNDHTYTITATNKTYGTKDTVSASITVYDKPTIKTASLPQYTIGSKYNGKISVTGLDASVDVTLAISGDSSTAIPSTLAFDKDSMTITGSLDQFPVTPTSADKYMLTLIATIKAGNPAYTEDADLVSRDIVIKVKGIPPKFTTSKISDFEGTGDNVDSTGDKHIISLTGTQPISIRAYIAAADAKKLSIGDGTEDIAIDAPASSALPATKKADGDAPVFTITQRTNGAATELLIGYAEDQGFALAGIPITISADNGASAPVVKVYKVGVTGASPIIKNSDGLEASKDITVESAAGTAITDIVFTASGDNPLEFSTNPKIGTTKNGLTATSSDAGLTISGTPTSGKETSTVFTITLTNPQTKKKYSRKVTIRGLVAPTITSKGTALTKVIEIGKPLNFKLAAKGSKTITWSIDVIAAISNDLGLSFDAKTGTIRGTAKGTTSDDGVYKPLTVNFTATNAAGSSTAVAATIGVKGKKPKMMTKTITFQVVSTDQTLSGDSTLKTDILTTDKTANVRWALYGGKTSVKPLTEIGPKVTTSTDRNLGYINVTGIKSSATGNTYATKGATLKVSADNIGSEIYGNVKIVIQDPAPVFSTTTPNNTNTALTITANKSSAKTGTVSLALQDWSMTGDTGMKWAISTKPTGKVTAAIKPINKNKDATLTVTVGKGLSSADISAKDKKNGVTHFWTVVGVTATNTSTKASATYKISVDVTPYDAGSTGALPEEKDALPEELAEDKELSEKTAEEEELAEDEELPAGEGTVTYGDVRAESALTQAERSMLAEGGYVIAAILPEITTDASGQYDLDVVSLDEAAAEGAELVWFAFPRNAESTEDDSIAEFYDEAGAEIYAVPESKKVVVSPWLEAEVTYAPVIAVKAPLAGDAKTSLDEAEAGDTVTEQAIENAAETPAEK